MTDQGGATARARAGRTAGPDLIDSLDRLARRHNRSAAFAAALTATGREPSAMPAAALFRVAAKAGLRCRRRRLAWPDLARLKDELPAIVSLSDGRRMLLLELREAGGTALAVLDHPRNAGADPVVVDRLRFEQVWTGEIVVVQAVTPGAAGRPFDWRTVAALLAEEPRLLRDAAACTVALAALAAAPILFVQLLLRRVLPARAEQSLLAISLVLLAIVIAEAIFRGLRDYLAARLAARAEARLSARMFDRLMALPPTALDGMPVGEACQRFGELRVVSETVSHLVPRIALDVGVLCLFLPLIAMLNAPLFLVFVALGGAGAALLIPALPRLRRAGERLAETRAARSAFLVQSLAGIGAIKGLALGPDRIRRWDRLTAAVGKARLDEARVADVIEAFALPAERLLVIGLLAVGFGVAALRGRPVELASLIGAVLLVQRAIAPLPDVVALARARGAARTAGRRLGDLVNRPAEAADATTAAPAVLEGRVAFEAVRFRYPEAAAPALRGVSFSIEPGTTLGIMGRSGAGKTTIVRLLQRLYAPQGGTIRIDGLDSAAIDPRRLRRAVALVPQTSLFLAGTIREIITASCPDAGFEAMTRAADAAGASEFIDRLPRGYETMLADGAPALSAGQRQRLALARALLTTPPILILDEALSALDADLEGGVEAGLREARQGLTTIIVSHRLPILMTCDAILVMADGEVRDFGPHHELLERCDLYGAAWTRQQGTVEGERGEGLLALS